MNESFEKEFYLRTSDFDCRMDLAPAAVLDLFQDVAGEHARLLGIGREAMLAERLIWVVVKVRYRILKTPHQYDRVTVKTWPLPPRRSIFQREYSICSAEGELLVAGSSEWVVIHADRRRLVPVGDVYPIKDGFLTGHSFEDGFPHLADFAPACEGMPVVPQFSDMDANGHVNNTKYANFVMNAAALGEGEHIREFLLEYHREIKGGTPFTLDLLREGNTLLAKGVGEDGARMFSARLLLEE